jgi:hypothetical protein
MTELVRTRTVLMRTKFGPPTKKTKERLDLESIVCAWNTCLRGAVSTMSSIMLLRNCPPTFRADYAYKLKDAGLINPSDVYEFLPAPTVKLRYL